MAKHMAISAQQSILVSTGEASGDNYVSRLISSMKEKHPQARFFGMGGEKCETASLERVARAEDVSVVGVTEVVTRLPHILKAYAELTIRYVREKPAWALLADFPDFNLILARMLKQMGCRIVYFIGPQLWAWRGGRLETLRHTIDRMVVIFPFEVPIYENAGIPVIYEGHPLVDLVEPWRIRNGEKASQKIRPGGNRASGLVRDRAPEPVRMRIPEVVRDRASEPVRIVLMPGSRPGEIEHHLPVMLQAAKDVHCLLPGARFYIPLATNISESLVLPYTHQADIPVEVKKDAAYEFLSDAHLAIVASGTATVETMLFQVPMVVIYRLSPLSFFMAKHLVKTDFIAMPNILAGRRVVPELIQEEVSRDNIVSSLMPLILNENTYAEMKTSLGEVSRLLGDTGVIERISRRLESDLFPQDDPSPAELGAFKEYRPRQE